LTSLDQHATPYLDALEGYVRAGTVSFHTPGHKHGVGMHARLRDLIGDGVLKLDLTQVRGLDDLNAPHGPIRAAQELAAAAYGASHSYFLINGSTVGNQAMLMTALRPGESVLLARNSHKSAVGALIMSGARPAYMLPEIDASLGIDHSVGVQAVERGLAEHPHAKAVFITSPTYYGAAADLAAIERLVHGQGKLLLVDEAWGPHLHFHPELPTSATTAGADMCVNSTHKLIAGMSQAAMLHVCGAQIDGARLRATLRLLQSTSPLLVLLASLDVARMQMATQGRELLSGALSLARRARARLREIPGIRCIGPEAVGQPGVGAYDETRIVVTVAALGRTGYEAAEFLRVRHDVQIELADLNNVVALVTIGDREADIDRLVSAVAAFARDAKTAARGDMSAGTGRSRGSPQTAMRPIPEQVVTPREAFLADHVEIPLQTSAGHVCAEVVTPYPPGIPVLCPGERITQETIDYLQLEVEAGAHLQGPADEKLRTIRVLSTSMR
jgi:arginine decarboxylase